MTSIAMPDFKRIDAAAAKLATIAARTTWPTLDPLPEATESAPQPFPFNGLGRLLGDAARSIADGVQAPDALAGGSVLASAALAAQAHADIVMPHGQRSPLSVFVVTGALSGDRKTAPIQSQTARLKIIDASRPASTPPRCWTSSAAVPSARRVSLRKPRRSRSRSPSERPP